MRASLPKKLASFRVATDFDPPTLSLFFVVVVVVAVIDWLDFFFSTVLFFCVEKEAAADVFFFFFYALYLNLFLHKLLGIVTY